MQAFFLQIFHFVLVDQKKKKTNLEYTIEQYMKTEFLYNLLVYYFYFEVSITLS